MSSYFDELNRELRELCEKQIGRDDNRELTIGSRFWVDYRTIEERVVKTVSLATGDREFPADLREKLMKIIATKRVFRPETNDVNEDAATYIVAMKLSELFEALHSAFHEVASRRAQTRFGMLSDNPEGIVSRRDAHDTDVEDARKLGLTHAADCPLTPCDCNLDRPIGGRR
ncbi:MAG: hypothetical protein EPN91_08650 [Salinibacterium sp.]|nr:MAG: hypothetical protein EPN91_08650 [Salinibacterium sp.]